MHTWALAQASPHPQPHSHLCVHTVKFKSFPILPLSSPTLPMILLVIYLLQLELLPDLL